MRFLVIKNLFKNLEKCISIKAKKFLHKSFVSAKSDYVHCVKTPTLLAKTTLGELFPLKEQLNNPQDLVPYVSGTVFYLKLQAAGLFKHLLFVIILKLHAIRIRKFKNWGSVVLQVNS